MKLPSLVYIGAALMLPCGATQAGKDYGYCQGLLYSSCLDTTGCYFNTKKHQCEAFPPFSEYFDCSAKKQKERSDNYKWKCDYEYSVQSWYPNCPLIKTRRGCNRNKHYCHWEDGSLSKRGKCRISCDKIWNLPRCLDDETGATKNCTAVYQDKHSCNHDHACEWDGTKCDFNCTNPFVYDYADDGHYCRAIAPCATFGKDECIEYRDTNENLCRWYAPTSKCMSLSELLALESEIHAIDSGFYAGQYHCDRTLEEYCKRKACRWDGGECKYHTCSVYNGDETECWFQSECTYHKENEACCKNGESGCEWPSSAPSSPPSLSSSPSIAPSSSPSEQPTTSMQPSGRPSLHPSRENECSSFNSSDNIKDGECGVANGCYWDENKDKDNCVDDPCAFKTYNECYVEDECAWMVEDGNLDKFDEGKCGSLEHASCRDWTKGGVIFSTDDKYDIWDSAKCNAKSKCRYLHFYSNFIYSDQFQGTPGRCVEFEDINCSKYKESEPFCTRWNKCEWKNVGDAFGCYEKPSISKCPSATNDDHTQPVTDDPSLVTETSQEADDGPSPATETSQEAADETVTSATTSDSGCTDQVYLNCLKEFYRDCSAPWSDECLKHPLPLPDVVDACIEEAKSETGHDCY